MKLNYIYKAIWALGNIAGDCNTFRDRLLEYGALLPLVEVVQNTDKPNILKHGIWAISNLCRGRPLPPFELVNPALYVFAKAIEVTKDADVLTDATWALSFLSEGDAHQIQRVLETGVVPALVNHLAYRKILNIC